MVNSIIPFYPHPEKILIKSRGCKQYDSEGKEYIDFESGVWCANLGHSHAAMIRAIENQATNCIHHGYRFRNEASEKLAVLIHDRIGFTNGQSVFLSSGSEAVNLAIMFARYETKRKKILKISNSYISAYSNSIVPWASEHITDIPFNNTDAIWDINFSEYAAFILETGGASIDTVQFSSNEFVEQIVGKAQMNGCLVVANEVTTGFGRLGKWFGFQHYKVSPDIVTMGKGLGNGYPVSALSINVDLSKKFSYEPFRYAQSHQNDPLGCTIGIEVIKTMEDEKLVERAENIGRYFIQQLEELRNRHPNKIKDTRGRGLMLALEFTDDIDGVAINENFFSQGFVVGFKNNTLRLLPPLVVSETEIASLISAIDEELHKPLVKSYTF